MIEFAMPSLGADMLDGTLCEWKVKPGDKVKRGDIIAVVETQKGLIDIEVFDEGSIGKLLIEVGKRVPVGTVMAEIIPEEEHISIKKSQDKMAEVLSSSSIEKHHLRASPLAKKIAKEKGIDLLTVKGTGADGAITKDDVEKVIAGKNIEVPTEKTKVNISVAENIRMAVAAAMSRSNREIPHYYLETKIDMGASLEWLTEENKKLPIKERVLPAALFVRAVAKALQHVPDLNAWWVDGLKRKKEINIGFVVSLKTGGIIVPAIHDSEKKTVNQLMSSLNDIIPRARALKLRSSELSDSTITITSLGDEGVETVYGVIYPPQVAIVGFGGITKQLWVKNNTMEIRPVLTATLAADHRATDGGTGSKFLMEVKKYLEQPELL